MEEGKLPWELLQEVVKKSGEQNSGIIQGPKAGCDVAVVDFAIAQKQAQDYYNSSAETLAVVKTDPITFPTADPGKYVVIVNANDVVTSGALPFGFNATIILPVSSDSKKMVDIQESIHTTCKKYGITVLGGHSEISSSVNTPVVSGAMIGFVPRDYYVDRKIKEGDVMLCTGWCAKEGMGIIASNGYEQLADILGEQTVEKLIDLGSDISVVESALSLNKRYHLELMHDATEGGVLAAAYETISAEGFGLQLFREKFPLTPETEQVCELLEVNPLRIISSGTLLLVVPKAKAELIIKESTSIRPITIIGQITNKVKGMTLNGKKIAPPGPDEVIKALKRIEEGCLR
jgi:hydrogenase maturation factor